jgi:hypothetical protein
MPETHNSATWKIIRNAVAGSFGTGLAFDSDPDFLVNPDPKTDFEDLAGSISDPDLFDPDPEPGFKIKH